MKVQSISAGMRRSYNNSVAKSKNSNPIQANPVSRANFYGVISFGANKRQDSIIFVGAECPPIIKKGGVATVMNDYKLFDPIIDGKSVINERIIVLPYYNGKKQYDITGEHVVKTDIHRTSDGKMWFTETTDTDFQADFDNKKANFYQLESVKKTTMQWGLDEQSPIELLKVTGVRKKGSDAVTPMTEQIYLVYTDATSEMVEPYADGSYRTSPNNKKGQGPNDWKGSAYAKFNKAFVKLLPYSKLESGHIILSDPQTAYIPEYIAQEVNAGNSFFDGITKTYVAHNLGDGYIQHVSLEDMFVNMGATKQEISAVMSDPAYYQSENMNRFFKSKKLVNEKLILSSNMASPTKLIIQNVKDGVVNKMITVSEEYAISAAENERVSGELQKDLKDLYDSGKFYGILNVLNDPNMTFNKPVSIPGYNHKLERTYGEEVIAFEPLRHYDFGIEGIENLLQLDAAKKIKAEILDVPEKKDEFLKHIKEVKTYNRKRVLERFDGRFKDDAELLAGLSNKKVSLLGYIDKKYAQADDTVLFTSWGRGDFQKGLDTVLDAFKKFVAKTNNTNAVLLFGGELPDASPETKNIKMLMANLPENLKGRVAYLSGFAPNAPLASAADATIFPSRFAPCELTDLESLKYFATPIVTGTQGLKQKNFDPRIESEKEKATSYKTETEFYEPYESLKKKIPELESVIKTHSDKLYKIYSRGELKESDIDVLVDKNLYSQELLQNDIRVLVDDKIAVELSEAMALRVSQSDELTEKMYINHMFTDTTWNGNAALHGPNGKSTAQKYYETITDNIAKNASNNISCKADSSKYQKELRNQAASKASDTLKKTNMFLSKKFAVIASLSLAAGAGAYYYFQKQKKDAQNPDGLGKDYDKNIDMKA